MLLHGISTDIHFDLMQGILGSECLCGIVLLQTGLL